MIQITEKQAIDMLNCGSTEKTFIEVWKEKGYIKRSKLDEILDSQDFYEILYAYRYASINDQKNVCEKFEDVKKYIRDIYEQAIEEIKNEV